MRTFGVTIAALAKRMNITQTRVRHVREKGVIGAEFVRDWRQAITGTDPGKLYDINPISSKPAGYRFKDYTVGYAKLPTADLERLADDLLALAQTLDTATKKSWVTEDQLNAALTVLDHRRAARNRNPVPASSRAGRRLPAGDDVERAADLYSRFSGHEAESIGKVPAPRSLKTAIAIGECDGILYTTVRDNVVEKYIHKFRAKDKPMMAVAPDGSQIVLLGGNYTFTERGIIDHSDKKNWKG
jgi:hypothetical protein